ncbi:MAG: N-acetylmuramoyl-L-alanine amidase, partial [Firmicutes bacterium]|nr:N-acetylmuramoyl-L-alanine amidase [Bacillota bacterium]
MTRRSDRELTDSRSPDAEELGARVNVANRAGAILFISIHSNAYEKDPGVSGVMSFHNGGADDARLARSLLDGVGTATGLERVGLERASFFVLRNSDMPSALVEIGFMTNARDEAKLASPEFRMEAARGLLVGIVEYLGAR